MVFNLVGSMPFTSSHARRPSGPSCACKADTDCAAKSPMVSSAKSCINSMARVSSGKISTGIGARNSFTEVLLLDRRIGLYGCALIAAQYAGNRPGATPISDSKPCLVVVSDSKATV